MVLGPLECCQHDPGHDTQAGRGGDGEKVGMGDCLDEQCDTPEAEPEYHRAVVDSRESVEREEPFEEWGHDEEAEDEGSEQPHLGEQPEPAIMDVRSTPDIDVPE